MPELEKVTINMSPVDLGKIDLLVGEGSYSNRTDFIRMAVRNQLEKHNIEIQQSVTRNAWMIGAMSIGNGDLAKYAQGAKRVNLNVGYLVSQGPDTCNQVLGHWWQWTLARNSVKPGSPS